MKTLKNKGFSMVELLVAMAIFFILAVGVIYVVTNSYTNFYGVGDRQAITDFAQEGLEAVNSIAANDWGDLVDAVGSNHGLTKNTNNAWKFNGTSDTLGDLTRVVTVANVNRSGGNISASGTDDPLTKKVTVTISGSGITDYVLESYITNWQQHIWTQTDWDSGSGFEFWSDESGYDSDDGTNIDTSVDGYVHMGDFKGTYYDDGWLYSSKLDLGSNDKELYQISVTQDLTHHHCDSAEVLIVTLEVDDNSAFSSATTQEFSYLDNSYTTAINANMSDQRWVRYKVDMDSCNKNTDTPYLYDVTLYYR